MASFTNTATLTYNGISVNSNTVTGELLEVLSAEKTAVTDTYESGGTEAYVISLVNSGTTALTGLTVTDDLGAYEVGTAPDTVTVYPLSYTEGSVRYFVNGVLQAAPTVTAGPPLVISGISVPAGGNVQIVYDTSVTEYAPLAPGGVIENEITVTGGGLSVPLTATEEITVREAAQLTVTKAVNPPVVAENGQLTYTFTIQNFGSAPVVATDGAVISDLFDPILDITSVTFNGAAWTEPENYTYNEATAAVMKAANFDNILYQYTIIFSIKIKRIHGGKVE